MDDGGSDDIEAAIRTLDAQRASLGNAVVDVAIAALRARRDGGGRGEQRSDPELKQVTLLFADVVGSTRLGRQLEPEDIHALMDGALRHLTDVVTAHHGRVLQYAGDNLLAVFGAGVSHEDDPLNAVRAGLAMIAETRRLQADIMQRYRLDGFDIRVGAHTGAVLLGAGVDGANSVRGNSVNIAARMEQTAPPGGLRISQDCHRHVRGRFVVVEQPPLEVRGVERPLVTYLVDNEVDDLAAASDEGPMIGREVQLATLQEGCRAAFGDMRAGARGLLVTGEAGMGKSRLQTALRVWLDAQPDRPLLLRARGNERRTAEPYGLLRDLLVSGTSPSGSDGDAAWMGRVTPLLGDEAEAAVLGHLLGFGLSEHPAVCGILGEGRQIRDRGFHYAVRLLECLADDDGRGRHVVVLLLDDLHWADDGSLDFLQHLLGTETTATVQFVGFTRPDLLQRRPQWLSGDPRAPMRIDLPAFDLAESETMISALLAPLDPVPAVLLDLLVTKAAGNPYHLAELVRMLVEQAIVERGDEVVVHVERLHTVALPTTLTGVLQARLDALPARLHRMLQRAAVVGHVFWREPLLSTGADDDADLRELQARGLVRPRDASSLAGQHEYEFDHQLLQRVCYERVLRPVRMRAHVEVARWLASQPGTALLDSIAEHFERGGDAVQALSYWHQSAEASAGRYANSVAVASAERALSLAGSDELPRRYALTRIAAKALRIQADRARLADMLERLAALAEALDDDALRSEAAEQRARYLDDGGDAAGALEIARRALEVAPPDAHERIARARLLMASSLAKLGRSEEARAESEAGLASARRSGNSAVEAMILNQMGIDADDAGDPSVGMKFFERALALHRQSGNLSNEAATLSNLGYAALSLGDYESASTYLAEALRLSKSIGNLQGQGIVRVNLALVAQCRGDAAGARELVDEALAALQRCGDRWGEAVALRVAGNAALTLAEYDLARSLFATSWTMLDALGLGHLAMEAIAGLALTELAAACPEAALECVEQIFARQAGGASLAGTDEPMRIGLACHLVLAAAGDARAAGMLERTRAELAARANRIADAATRRRYVDDIPVHRELCRLCGGAAAPQIKRC